MEFFGSPFRLHFSACLQTDSTWKLSNSSQKELPSPNNPEETREPVKRIEPADTISARTLFTVFGEGPTEPGRVKGEAEGQIASTHSHPMAAVASLTQELSSALVEAQRYRNAMVGARSEVGDKDFQSLCSLIQEHTRKRETNVVDLEARLAQKDVTILQLEKALAEKGAVFVELTVGESGSATTPLEAILAEKEVDIVRLGEQLAEKGANNLQLKERLEEQSARGVYLEERLAEQHDTIAQLRETQEKNARHLSSLVEILAQRDAAISQLQGHVAEKETEGNLRAKRTEVYYEAKHDALKSTISRKDEDIARLKALLKTNEDTTKDVVSQCEYDIAKLMDRLSECNKQLEASRRLGQSPKLFREEEFSYAFPESLHRRQSRQGQPAGWSSEPNSLQPQPDSPIISTRI